VTEVGTAVVLLVELLRYKAFIKTCTYQNIFLYGDWWKHYQHCLFL